MVLISSFLIKPNEEKNEKNTLAFRRLLKLPLREPTLPRGIPCSGTIGLDAELHCRRVAFIAMSVNVCVCSGRLCVCVCVGGRWGGQHFYFHPLEREKGRL